MKTDQKKPDMAKLLLSKVVFKARSIIRDGDVYDKNINPMENM